MPGQWRATCIQMPSENVRKVSTRAEGWEIIERNLDCAHRMINQAMLADPPPALLVLPEFAFQGPPKGEHVAEWIEKACHPVPGPITEPLAELAGLSASTSGETSSRPTSSGEIAFSTRRS